MSEIPHNRFRSVKTEYGPEMFAGADYGRPVRVLMRGPKAVVFTGYGIHLWVRESQRKNTLSFEVGIKSFSDRATETLATHFGEGAAAEAIKALTRRGMGTVLVEGGGEPLPESARVLRERREQEFSQVTPTRSMAVDMDIRGCKQCDAPLSPLTTIHYLDPAPKEGHPTTVEECQRLSNSPVLSVYGFKGRRDSWKHIETFETWDGETYKDPDFCSDRCASNYGRRAARELPLLTPDGSTVAKPPMRHGTVKHYTVEEKTITTNDGKTFRI